MQAENKESLESFAWRLNRAQETLGLSQAEIAARLGATPQRVGNWFQGRNFPRKRELLELCRLLGTSVEALVHGETEKSSDPVDFIVQEAKAEYGVSVREVPVISWTHAGDAASYEAMPRHWHGRVASSSRDPRAFALIVEGDSMEPKFFSGDRVVCEPTHEPRNGKPVVAKYDNEEVQLRIYHKLPSGKIRLASLRPEIYPTVELAPAGFRWIFPVVELIRSV